MPSKHIGGCDLAGNRAACRLAQFAVQKLAAGRPAKTGELVAALRAFIREGLDLDPIPKYLLILVQGPARILASAKGKGTAVETKGGGEKGGGEKGTGMMMGSGMAKQRG